MIHSELFYWLQCDVEGCEDRIPSDASDAIAWQTVDQALDDAGDSDWTITDDGKHFCPDHTPEDPEDPEEDR